MKCCLSVDTLSRPGPPVGPALGRWQPDYSRLSRATASKHRGRKHLLTPSVGPEWDGQHHRSHVAAAAANSSAPSTSGRDDAPVEGEDVLEMVEIAMLAAVSGLIFVISTTIGLDKYCTHVFPLPIIVASLRRGRRAGWGTMNVSSCLILVLLGPLRALSYALTHGVPSAILADCWARGTPWKASVPLVGVVKTVCQLATVALASVTMGQNLVALSVANIGAMLDRAGVMLFKSSAAGAFATNQLLYGFFGVMLVLNCILYSGITHALYYTVMKALQYDIPEPAGWIARALHSRGVTS